MRKADLLVQIDLLQQLLVTQAAEQRALIARLNERVELQERRYEELEVRVQQRIDWIEQAYAADLSLSMEARERQQGVVSHLRNTVEAHRKELRAIESELGPGAARSGPG